MKKHKYLSGFTLVELILSLAISAILLLIILQLLMSILNLKQRLKSQFEINSTITSYFSLLTDDIRWADQIIFEPNKITLIENIENTQNIHTYVNRSGKLIRIETDGTEKQLNGDTIEIVSLNFSNESDITNDYPPLIHTTIVIRSTSGNPPTIISQDLFTSNLRYRSTVNGPTITPIPSISIIPTITTAPTVPPTTTPTIAFSPTPTFTPTPTPSPAPDCTIPNNPGIWSSNPIGSSRPGRVNSNLTYSTVCGDGQGITNTADHFQFASLTTNSNTLEFTTEITNVISSSNPGNQYGIMIRQSTNSVSSNVAIYKDDFGQIFMSYRRNSGEIGVTLPIKFENPSPKFWFKLIKSNNNYFGYYSLNSTDGANGNWKLIGELNNMPQITSGNYLYGLAVSSRDRDLQPIEYKEFSTVTFGQIITNNSITPITILPTNTPTPTSLPTPTPTITATPTNTPTPTIFISD